MYIFLPNPVIIDIVSVIQKTIFALGLKTNHEFVGFSPQFPESSLVHYTSLQSKSKKECRVSLSIYSHCGDMDRKLQHTVCSRAERDSSNTELLANGDTAVAIFIL